MILLTERVPYTHTTERLTFSPDGSMLLLQWGERDSVVWDAGTGGELRCALAGKPFGFHPTLPRVVGLDTNFDLGWIDPRTAASGAICRVASWWAKPPTGPGVVRSPAKRRPVSYWTPHRCLLTPDGTRVLAYSLNRSELAAFDTSAGHDAGPVWQVDVRRTGSVPRVELGLLPDSSFAALEDFGNLRTNLAVRSLADGGLVAETRVPCKSVGGFAVAPDGGAAVLISDARLIVCDVANLGSAPRVVAKENPKVFTGVAFHPSGRYVAATSNDGSVHLYETGAWQVVRAFAWKLGRAKAVAFSPDGTRAAARCELGVVVWDVDV